MDTSKLKLDHVFFQQTSGLHWQSLSVQLLEELPSRIPVSGTYIEDSNMRTPCRVDPGSMMPFEVAVCVLGFKVHKETSLEIIPSFIQTN